MTDIQTRRRFVQDHPAYKNLLEAANLIDQASNVKDVPDKAAVLMENAQVHVRTSIEVLLEPDALKNEMGTICVMLLGIANYKLEKDKRTGKMIEVVDIATEDEPVFIHAIKRLRELPAKFAPQRRGKAR